MSKSLSQRWIDKARHVSAKTILNNQKAIDACLGVARSIHNFALSRSPLSFIEGGVTAVVALSKSLNGFSHQFFNITNGWSKAVDSIDHKPLYSMLQPILNNFPFKRIEFLYESNQQNGIYDTSCGEIGLDKNGIWFKESDGLTKEKVLKFLMDEKLKGIKSNFFSVVVTKVKDSASYDPVLLFDLKDEDINCVRSRTSEKYLTYVKPFLDKGEHRSFLFVGVPGSGKTTLAQTLISDLNFRTLKFNYNPKQTNLETIKLIISVIGVEAVILDDFDQTTESNALLDFLSWIHSNVKLTLLVSNTLKTFHPAILRPERIDQIFRIDSLDESVVLALFGEDKPELTQRIKQWPIAFLNELLIRLEAHPELNLEENLAELEDRVKKQANALKQ